MKKTGTMQTKVNLLTGKSYTEVTLPEGLGTCDIMDWVDENPNAVLNHTFFRMKYGEVAVVSDQDHTAIDAREHWLMETEDLGTVPQKLYNGWERIGCPAFGWFCKKEDKIIFITF
jgi:hypothetical protein